MTASWKKGRGKLGMFAPLIGDWRATGDGPMGKTTVTRSIQPVLNGKYIEMRVQWSFKPPKGQKARGAYEEICLFGPHDEHGVGFWSFTSDGKRSNGWLTEAPDIHEQAIAFEADMPAGRARMSYWPDEQGFRFAVESRTKKGWNRFLEHAFTPS